MGLLGADGLLVLERLDGVLAARLIAVRTGACLFAESFPDEKEVGKIVALLAAKTARVAPKLLVDRSDALPVSVLNIRAALFTPDNARLESSLTRLLEWRLAALQRDPARGSGFHGRVIFSRLKLRSSPDPSPE